MSLAGMLFRLQSLSSSHLVLLRHSSRPVDHYSQRRIRLRLHHRVDQKTLSVARYGIGRIVGLNSPGAEIEKRNRRAHLEALAASYRRRHQLPVSRVVE